MLKADAILKGVYKKGENGFIKMISEEENINYCELSYKMFKNKCRVLCN